MLRSASTRCTRKGLEVYPRKCTAPVNSNDNTTVNGKGTKGTKIYNTQFICLNIQYITIMTHLIFPFTVIISFIHPLTDILKSAEGENFNPCSSLKLFYVNLPTHFTAA